MSGNQYAGPSNHPFIYSSSSAASSPTNHSVPTSNIRNAHPSSSSISPPASVSAPPYPFTDSMRDKQARGKDPWGRRLSPPPPSPPRPRAYPSSRHQQPTPYPHVHAHPAASTAAATDGMDMDDGYRAESSDSELDPEFFDPADQDAFVGGLDTTSSAHCPPGDPGVLSMAEATKRAFAMGGRRQKQHSQSSHHHHRHQQQQQHYHHGKEKDSYESWRKRENARTVLENPELLMWYASSREDSIPGTRLHFTRVLCGYDEDAGGPASHFNRTPRKGGAGSSSRHHMYH